MRVILRHFAHLRLYLTPPLSTMLFIIVYFSDADIFDFSFIYLMMFFHAVCLTPDYFRLMMPRYFDAAYFDATMLRAIYARRYAAHDALHAGAPPTMIMPLYAI